MGRVLVRDQPKLSVLHFRAVVHDQVSRIVYDLELGQHVSDGGFFLFVYWANF